MPNQIAEDRCRVTYIEEEWVRDEIQALASKWDIAASDIIREATHRYLSSLENKNVFVKAERKVHRVKKPKVNQKD